MQLRYVELDKSYEDTVTGFVGLATAKTEYIDCEGQVYLESPDGLGGWFQVSRLEQVV
jgi:hypothetical protein